MSLLLLSGNVLIENGEMLKRRKRYVCDRGIRCGRTAR